VSDTQGWYARKLAQMRGGPQPYQPPPQQQAPPQQTFYQQQAPAQPAYQSPPTASKQGQASLTGLLELQKHGQALEPGRGAKANPEPCPNCGSDQYFAAVDTADVKVRRGPPPNSHCFACGYNGGLFSQGDASTWGATA
jgi:hypothetical protein